MKIPLYRVVLKNDGEGIEFISLVDRPAIKRNWIALRDAVKFKAVDEDRQILMGPLLIPGEPVYREDEERGKYAIVFEADQILAIQEKFFHDSRSKSFNLMHEEGTEVQGVFLTESFIINKAAGKQPKGYEDLPDGTWFVTAKVQNDRLWKEFIKTGDLKGFSIEGVFSFESMSEIDLAMREVINILDQIKDIS